MYVYICKFQMPCSTLGKTQPQKRKEIEFLANKNAK